MNAPYKPGVIALHTCCAGCIILKRRRGADAQRNDVEIEGRHLKLSNLDKVLYPEAGFTKGQVIDYYVRIAPVLLPHLRAGRSP